MPDQIIEKRKEKRLGISSVNLPFLGTRGEDQSCFQYVILDMSKSGIGFVIPNWVVNREAIKKNDLVNLHLPLKMEDNFYNQGLIMWTKWDDELQGKVCGAGLSNTEHPPYPVFISIESGSVSVDFDDFDVRDNLLCRVVKDTAFLKRGVDIYLGHLIPYFSRISMYPPEEYPLLKESILEDIHSRVREHCDKLEALYEKIRTEMPSRSDVAKFIDLEELRSIIESEIYIEILRVAFSNESVMPYLNAIKDLEKRLYFNYNTIVMLYVHSL